MTYARVIPRDLFNEASLLKCLGRLFIVLENARAHSAILGDGATHGAQDDYCGDAFDIGQDCDGAIFVANLPFYVAGVSYDLFRPLNSRELWPLWLKNPDDEDFEPIEVFDVSGSLSPEMRVLIGLKG